MQGPVGILALQGDFALHAQLLSDSDVETVEVRGAEDLTGVSGLLLPGGESTTIAMGIDRENLKDPIRNLAKAGLPVFGTCAGMVLMSSAHLGLIDMEVERNAFGRQIHSFEADLKIDGLDGPPVRGLFIRAPVVTFVGDAVRVFAEIDGSTVGVKQDNCTAISFHPELVGDARLHLLALGLKQWPELPASS
ncbi:MAG: pyridoxal 5'-phosphate synthase glutaminase subunit PdxT [Actinobacteria bacterium]|nr:pyridoxal 5'-phosphate synthase glutaminase subunit PdxT [Actinomycetota bacterium]